MRRLREAHTASGLSPRQRRTLLITLRDSLAVDRDRSQCARDPYDTPVNRSRSPRPESRRG